MLANDAGDDAVRWTDLKFSAKELRRALSPAEVKGPSLPNWAVKGIGDLGTLGSEGAAGAGSLPALIKD